MVFSHQTKDLESFADSSNTPWNPPTIHCPDLTATIPQMSLLSLCALLFLQSHLFLICVALTYNDSGTAVPARLLQEALVIFVFKQISQFVSFVHVDTVLTRTGSHLFATPLVIQEKIWKYLDPGAPRGSEGLLSSTKFSLNSCSSRASHAKIALLLRVCPSFLFLFSVSVGLCCRFTVAPHSYFHFFLVLDFRCIC